RAERLSAKLGPSVVRRQRKLPWKRERESVRPARGAHPRRGDRIAATDLREHRLSQHAFGIVADRTLASAARPAIEFGERLPVSGGVLLRLRQRSVARAPARSADREPRARAAKRQVARANEAVHDQHQRAAMSARSTWCAIAAW